MVLSSEIVELNEMLKEISEGIKGLIGEIHDWRNMDVKIHYTLEDIWSTMQDLVWKLVPELI